MCVVSDGTDLDVVGVLSPHDGELAQQRVLAGLHNLSRIILDMVIAQQVQKAVHKHEAALVGWRVAKPGCLALNHLGRQDDIAKLDELIGRKLIVKS